MEEMDIDPIEELHEIRRKLYKEAGGTPEAFARYLMKQQEQYAGRLVDLGRPEPAPRKCGKKPAAIKPARKGAGRKARVAGKKTAKAGA